MWSNDQGGAVADQPIGIGPERVNTVGVQHQRPVQTLDEAAQQLLGLVVTTHAAPEDTGCSRVDHAFDFTGGTDGQGTAPLEFRQGMRPHLGELGVANGIEPPTTASRPNVPL